MKKSNIIITVLFSIYIGAFFMLNVLSSDKTFSELENRNLAKKPQFSFSDLFAGDFTKDYETYVTDQFVFRDGFVEIKSNTESILLKKENNGVYITTQNTLIDKFEKPSYTQIDNNIKNINAFAQNIDTEVYLSIIPTQNDVYSYKLPKNAPVTMQKEMIDYVSERTNNFISVYDTLMNKNDEYIFYNTDHHWTSLGAYYAYTNIIQHMGKEPIELPAKNTVSSNFNGTIFSKSGIRYAQSDEIDIYTDNFEITIEDAEGSKKAEMYDFSKLETVDKYAMFLSGNHPIVTLKGTGQGKLLIIKDSYTNSQVPFFVENFEEIHMIDLRFYKMPASEYITQNEIDTVLIQYSAPNFATDRNMAFLK